MKIAFINASIPGCSIKQYETAWTMVHPHAPRPQCMARAFYHPRTGLPPFCLRHDGHRATMDVATSRFSELRR
ncbi:hypothetical protein ACR4XJ_11620 [Nitratidesulfovibrio sp. D1]|uniref:hypothetical protein n=1 Tax=Nitratidesulfovibrio sp. D1 TaxID=3440151 RepID=UPI003EBB7CF1